MRSNAAVSRDQIKTKSSDKRTRAVDVSTEHRAAAISESEFDFIMSEMDRIANSKSRSSSH